MSSHRTTAQGLLPLVLPFAILILALLVAACGPSVGSPGGGY